MAGTVDEPTVTVVLPTRDRPEGLRAAIDSALAQTYGPLEIIVVDDGSLPPAQVGPEARLVRLDRPAGPGAARNRGAAEAKGDVLAFLDDDDRWRPDYLNRQVAALQSRQAAATCSRWTLRDGSILMDTSGPPSEGLADWILREPLLVPSSLVVRTDVFLGLGGFDADLRFGEDWDLAVRLVEDHRVVAVPEVLVDRTWHPHRRYGSRLLTDHREMMRRIGPRLRSRGTVERLRIRRHHWQRLGVYGARWALEPMVVGRWPWRARHALRRRRAEGRS